VSKRLKLRKIEQEALASKFEGAGSCPDEFYVIAALLLTCMNNVPLQEEEQQISYRHCMMRLVSHFPP
jgi:hypothetical protein